jgi:hypothetical protein
MALSSRRMAEQEICNGNGTSLFRGLKPPHWNICNGNGTSLFRGLEPPH